MRIFDITLPTLIVLAALSPISAEVSKSSPDVLSADFGSDKWDKSKWRALRLANQDAPQAFLQNPDSLSTSFSSTLIKQQMDNALLAAEIGPPAGELQVTFSIGPEPGAAAGVFVGKTCSADVFYGGTVMFVANNRLAVWSVESDQNSKAVKYTHLGQLAHPFSEGEKHVLKCSFDEKGNIAVSVDNTDVLSFRNCQVGSTLGIWGCHGSTTFFTAAVRKIPTLDPTWRSAPTR